MRTVLAAALALLLWTAGAPRAAGRPQDLDAFMENALARRDENWKKLQQYILDEREQFDIRGPSRQPVWGEVREFTWFLKDGFFVRSPLKVNGAVVSDSDRRAYESDYLRRVQERDRRSGPPDAPAAPVGDVQSLIRQTRQPQFIDTAYFLRFRFERGRYALVARETFEGRPALRVEYYPTRLFRHEQEMQERRAELKETNPDRDRKAAMERMINKVALVTLWIDAADGQIVKYAFDNVNLEFLPAAWLLHLDGARASMTMAQAVPQVWLPREVEMIVEATMATGAFEARYRVEYSNYREAETSSSFRVRP